MARKPCTFRKADVTRALRATVAAGIQVERVEIDKNGKIVLVAVAADGHCDDLDHELARFEAAHSEG